MWTCPKCERVFKTTNQSHYCNETTLDAIFENKPDDILLAFDKIMMEVINWEPCNLGVAKKAIVFTSHKAWLIVRPMSKVLDVKFYNDEALDNRLFHKVDMWGKKYAHHIRLKNEEEVTEEVFDLLKIGHTFSLK